MRARLLKPGFFDDEQLCRLPMGARLLFAGLWCLADREGRLKDIPRRVAAEVFPHDEEADVSCWLAELASAGFIARYQANGIKVIQIVSFSKHQTLNVKERVSELPPHPAEECPACEKKMSSTENARAQNVKLTLPPEAEAEAEAEAEKERAAPRTDSPEDLATRIREHHPAHRRGPLLEVQRAIAEQINGAVNISAIGAKMEGNHSAWCRSEEWTKENGKFCPGLARWLRSRGWTEPPPKPKSRYRDISEVDL
jgi:hypothetical protein